MVALTQAAAAQAPAAAAQQQQAQQQQQQAAAPQVPPQQSQLPPDVLAVFGQASGAAPEGAQQQAEQQPAAQTGAEQQAQQAQQQAQQAQQAQRPQRRQAENEEDGPLSPLGPGAPHRAPRTGVALAAGELALRAAEERRRRMVAFVTAGSLPGAGRWEGGARVVLCKQMAALHFQETGWTSRLHCAFKPTSVAALLTSTSQLHYYCTINPSAERRMDTAAPPASKDRQGVHVNTADCDCAHCAADLWLSAVVSPAAPGVAVCPEHADVSLGGMLSRGGLVWLGGVQRRCMPGLVSACQGCDPLSLGFQFETCCVFPAIHT